MYFLMPIHLLMGAVHGAIVNRAGHMIGYRNHHTDDHSKNTLVIDILTVGELFQNNHHNNGSNPKFANKRREIDPTYLVMKILA
jgi:stearoyl-CoA desaturase (delta-9 desaturase)